MLADRVRISNIGGMKDNILYDNGIVNEKIVGEWKSVIGSGSPIVNFESTRISIRCPLWSDVRLITSKLVSFSGYTSINIEYSRSASEQYMELNYLPGGSVRIINGNTIIYPSIASLPVKASSATEFFYVANTGAATLYITKIYLS